MDCVTLLDLAVSAGLTVTAAGDRLFITGPRRAAALAGELVARKSEILRMLSPARRDSTTDPDEQVPDRRTQPDVGLGILRWLRLVGIGCYLGRDGQPRLSFRGCDPSVDRAEVLDEVAKYRAEVVEELLAEARREATADGLGPPRSTPWGTMVCSAPGAEPLEWFGPPPEPAGLEVPPEPDDDGGSVADGGDGPDPEPCAAVSPEARQLIHANGGIIPARPQLGPAR